MKRRRRRRDIQPAHRVEQELRTSSDQSCFCLQLKHKCIINISMMSSAGGASLRMLMLGGQSELGSSLTVGFNVFSSAESGGLLISR